MSFLKMGAILLLLSCFGFLFTPTENRQVVSFDCSFIQITYSTESCKTGKNDCYRPVQHQTYVSKTCEKCKPGWEPENDCSKTRCSGESDSKFCFPGSCPGYTESCRCYSGFGGTNCLSLYEKPKLLYCLADVHRTDGNVSKEKAEANCSTNPRIFTKLLLNRIDVNYIAIYEWERPAYFSQPSYIRDFKVGMISSTAYVSKNGFQIGQQSCRTEYNQNNPAPLSNPKYDCRFSIPVSGPINHGDKFKVSVTNKNGGYVKVHGSYTITNYYTGTTLENFAEFQIDLKNPYHCSVEKTCTDKMLDIGSALTTKNYFTIKWSNWKDNDAGINKYEYAVYSMGSFGEQLGILVNNVISKGTINVTRQIEYPSVTLPKRGVYCVLLTVIDVAGNVEHARKFLIFDKESKVETNNRYNMEVQNGQATEKKQTYWMTTLTEQIKVSWSNHFINKYHVDNKFLASIRAHSPDINKGYEELTGVPPQTRSRQSISNINGILKVKVAKEKDSNGGKKLTGRPQQWEDVSEIEFKNQKKSFQMSRNDGDTIRIWVRAFDVMSTYGDDFVTIFFDSSPPIIKDVGLRRWGSYVSAIHHSEDFKKMKLSFVTFDDHSGLLHIFWELHDSENPQKIHGKDSLSVQKIKNSSLCLPPFCGCSPDGTCYNRNYEIDLSQFKNIHEAIHNFDYYFIIKVTNNANLVKEYKYKLTIDDTPPQGGKVIDGPPGSSDVDYQQEFELQASWFGFHDKESGILFYQYIFDTSCANSSKFSLQPHEKVKETTDSFASLKIDQPGVYYATVVAFNGALEPSLPVCTDGITIDISPPLISEIILGDNYVQPGILMDNQTQQLWFVNKQRFRLPINASQSCRSEALIVNNIEDWPISNGNRPAFTDHSCSYYGSTSNLIFIHTLSNLNISWKVTDEESGLYDCYIGLGSTDMSLNPDILPFTSTKGHTKFWSHHWNLDRGDIFYLIIKAINKAKQEIIKVLGPVLVVVIPPAFLGPLNVKYVERANEGYLMTTWNQSAFSDRGSLDDGKQFEFAIGTSKGGTELMPFTTLSDINRLPDICGNSSILKCITIPVKDLQWNLHGRHIYYMSIKAISTSGLSVIGTSEPYYHSVILPHKGLVHEAKASEIEEPFPADIDYQNSTDSLWIFWFNFADNDQEISYEVGLGTHPEITDVIPYTRVPSSVNKYQFTNLTLDYFKKFYCTVKASNKVGVVKVSSDGILILPASPVLLEINLKDGLGCMNPVVKSFTNVSRFIQPCQDNVDYQISLTTVSAHWTIPEKLLPYFTHVVWGVERLEQDNRWVMIHNFEDLHSATFVSSTSFSLNFKYKYRSVIKVCHPEGCSEPISTNGFQIIHHHPLPGIVTHLSYNKTDDIITASWTSFSQPYINNSVVITHYDWSLISHDGGLLLPWKQAILKTLNDDSKQLMLSENLPFHLLTCVTFALRGYNIGGFFSTVKKELPICNERSTTFTVIDAVSSWNYYKKKIDKVYLAKNTFWEKPDEEYTNNSRSLSAVWPNLKHPSFLWKVLSNRNLKIWSYIKEHQQLSYKEYPCDAPEVLKCGTTKDNFVNVEDLPLEHGQRYFICIYANTSKIQYETFEDTLPEISACTNGITVDLTAPVAGKVKLGWDEEMQYQISTSELIVRWNDFVDVEEHGYNTHISGIQTYQVAIGTTFGGVDVKDFQNVDSSNHFVFHGLKLQNGQSYFASVKAIDFVGFSSVSVSDKIVVDSTPPVLTTNPIKIRVYQHSITNLGADWHNVFFDKESGISIYEWCIGSIPHLCDITSFSRTFDEISQSNIDLLEGHLYYVTIKAYNGAGLFTSTSSMGIIVDASPPILGVVIDGNRSLSEYDQNYQTSLSTLSAHWNGFHDPHTVITHYAVSVGTCLACSDLIQEINVGLFTEMHWTSLSLVPGQIYHVTVKACNAAGLCSEVSSDGIIPDNTPPTLGLVFDGNRDGDIDWQKSRDWLAVHWFNFKDLHSGLSYYEWRAGTSPGGADILPGRKVPIHLSGEAFAIGDELMKLLPLKQRIYITVSATNNAGLSSEKSSNGFEIDDTPPIVKSGATIDYSQGSLLPGTQYWLSNLKVFWKFEDDESTMMMQMISIETHHPTPVELPSVKLSGSFKSYHFTNLSLHDGESYFVRIIGCNAAKICTTTESSTVLIDSSAPVTGSFSGSTSFTSNVVWNHSDWMVYEQQTNGSSAKLKLAWLGFFDPDSAIIKYYLAVGSSYRGFNLTENKWISFLHKTSSIVYFGHDIQTAVIDINRNLVPGEQIYITISAENGVGLLSPVFHSSFLIVQSNIHSGLLEFIRRCEIQTCQKHCTCSARGSFCSTDSTQDCLNVAENFDYQMYIVQDFVNLKDNQDVHITTSKCSLAAIWRAKSNSSGLPAIAFEWSVGLYGSTAGSGVFDLSRDQIWFDAGTNHHAILAQGYSTSGFSLELRRKYVFFVRAWYAENKFAVFQSNGVLVDFTPPKTKARKVKEVKNETSSDDIDYTTDRSTLTINWKNVFSDAETNIVYYLIGLSTIPGGDNIITYMRLASSVYYFSFQNLSLQPGIKYFSSVIAVNEAGLYSDPESSDGVLLDVDPPESGVVWDGIGLKDLKYQNQTTLLSASWHGFSDSHSFIHHYLWCVGSSPATPDILPCSNVGLKQSVSTVVNPISHQKYYSLVYAVDASGLHSPSSSSNGVIIDVTAPKPLTNFNFGSNLIKNPSFENNNLEFWDTNGRANILIETPDLNAADGQFYLIILGSISQTINTLPGEKYRISFYTSFHYKSGPGIIIQEGFIKGPGLDHIFSIESNSIGQWQIHYFYFIAYEPVSLINLGSANPRSGIILDYISVQSITTSDTYGSSPIILHLDRVNKKSTVQAQWEIVDPESNILEYLWAIGTIKGGTQLQSFRSVGQSSFAINDQVNLIHNSTIYITVVAVNNAELRAVFYSNPLEIDLTPPDLCCVKDGNSTKDQDYFSTGEISCHWRAVDLESTYSCQWALGANQGSEDIYPFTSVNSGFGSASLVLAHGTQVYCTVICENSIGLKSIMSSNGAHIVTKNPSHQEALVRVITNSPTYYPNRNNHQSNTTLIDVQWFGFKDEAGIKNYQIKVGSSKFGDICDWLTTGKQGETFAVLKGLNLISYNIYQVYVRAVNLGGLVSAAIYANVSLETTAPEITGNIISVSWPSIDKLHLNWASIFTSNSNLIYEVSVVPMKSGETLLKWYETRETTLLVNEVDKSKEYQVIITAINEAGLYQTQKYDVIFGKNAVLEQ